MNKLRERMESREVSPVLYDPKKVIEERILIEESLKASSTVKSKTKI